MHWKGLRLGALYDSEKRHLTEPQIQSRHSEQLHRPTQSTTNLAPRNSESLPRSPISAEDDNDHGESGGNKGTFFAGNTSLKSKLPSALHASRDNLHMRGNRFSLMRLRHASDPQLSKSYAKGEAEAQTPPVPSIPPPPTIITTAPTSHELDQPIKRKNKLRILPDSRKLSMEALPEQQAVSGERPKNDTRDSTGSQSADPSLSASRVSTEEPGRLSTTSIRSAGRDRPNGSHRSSVVDVRYSESSRSDQSTGENGISRTNSPGGTSSGTKRFRMPRLKRNRGPLFPLPPKPTGSQFGADGPTAGLTQSKSVPDGPTRRSDASDGHDHISPLPSPSRSSAGLSASRPPLSRKDSSNSANSAHSTPSVRNRGLLANRARSSTLDSVTNMRDTEYQPSPPLPSSGRTSFSTTGRKSFGDIFGISNRLRQNSEPGSVRNNGSPGGTKAASTPLTKVQSYPERQEDDTPATYLTRLEENIPKSTIAGVLSQSGEDFYKNALRKFMRGFAYFGDPIDMAIRKLLMEVELPKETQQIDRFLQSFADRYHECNPGIFASTDQAYFIAFSILILHTDVFNKNNKRKMQKGDYVKNTRGEGVAEDILECFYENISYTPFIRIEDSNMSTRHLAKPRKALFRVPSAENLSRVAREPVDPYALIMDGKLESLRPSFKEVMNLEDPYGCNPTTGPSDIDSLHEAFAQSGILQIISARSRPDAFMPASMINPADSTPGLVDIKVAKVGLLWRKDPKKKRARSPWQEWGALLTLSHLYFFKDANWVKSLMAQRDSHQREGRRRAVVFRPPLTNFNPDGMMSTDHAVALLDSSYKKHKHAFIFVRPNSLEEVFLANNEADMNDWLAKLNYAAAFRTTGVGAKGLIVTKYDAQRNRMSRRPSFRSDISHVSGDKEPTTPGSGPGPTDELMAARKRLIQQKIKEANEQLFTTQRQLDDILRNARHLQILTPVHFRARENLIMAAGRMAAKLKWVRQDLWRTRCHREVLVRDLGEESDQLKPAPEPQRLRLEIPASTSSLADSVSAISPRADKPASPIPKSPAALSEKQASVYQVSSPSSSLGGVRRPSLATSVTSPDLIARAGRPPSIDNTKERTNSVSPNPPNGLEREPSVLSSASKMDVASLASKASKLTLPGSFDDGEERLLREAGLLDAASSPSRKGSVAIESVDSEPKKDEAQDASQSDRMSRVRHSFHRTLRDSSSGHHGNHPRSRKRDSTPSASALEDGQSGEGGLSRKGGSFTVHGKKASIVTFGSDWQNMPPEERLKLRKPTPSEEPRASDTDLISVGSSVRSGVRASMDVPRKVSEETHRDLLDTRSVLSESALSAPISHDDEPISPATVTHDDHSSIQAANEKTVDELENSSMPQSYPQQAVNA